MPKQACRPNVGSDHNSYTSWILTPDGAEWPSKNDEELNPYIRWRKMLWSWHKAIDRGWKDEDFILLVKQINDAIERTTESKFTITPTGIWENASDLLPSSVIWKDETQNVGGSHKARHLMGLLLHLAVDSIEENKRLAISSCGNAAIGAATVARAAGRPIDVFIPTWANPSIVAELESLGAQIHVCERKKGQLGDPCMVEFHKAIESGSLPFGVQATENILTLDGGRTIGWELAEAFEDNPADDLFIQVGGGALLTSCAIGLFEAAKFGKLSKVPKIWAVQSEGCAPFDAAWIRIPTEKPVEEVIEYCQKNHSELMQPWANPTSIATGILDDITYDWIGVARSLLLSKGGSVVAREDQIVQASELVPKVGIQTEPTGAASVAGAINAFEAGQIDARTVIAVLLTGKDRSVNQGLD